MKGRYALVYQGGIANVFEVAQHSESQDFRGKTTRIKQGAFLSCYSFAQGLEAAGARVVTYSANVAGDVEQAHWFEGLDECPFRESAVIVGAA